MNAAYALFVIFIRRITPEELFFQMLQKAFWQMEKMGIKSAYPISFSVVSRPFQSSRLNSLKLRTLAICLLVHAG